MKPIAAHAAAPAAAHAAAPPFQVAVVGAGLVGLATALGCAQAGLRVALVGRGGHAPALPPAGLWDTRIYAISAASRRLLQDLRVWDRLAADRVAPVRDMRVLAAAEAARGLHFSAYEAATEALAWIMEHGELARVLATALDYQHGVTRFAVDAGQIVWPASVADRAAPAGQDQGEAALGAPHFGGPERAGHRPGPELARLTLSDGRVVAAELIIGADGKDSAVRAAAGLQARRRSYGQHGVVANFRAGRPHGGVAWQWFTDQGIVALLPLPGQDVSLVWSAPDALATELVALPPAELAGRVLAVAHEVAGSLEPLGQAAAFPLGVMDVDAITAPGLALVGDAAHLVHPLAGQGLNLGFQDAAVLLGVLRARESFRSCGDPVLLRRYARQRAAPVAAMRAVTDGLQRLFAAQAPAVRTLRSTGMNLLQGLPVLKKALVRHAMG